MFIILFSSVADSNLFLTRYITRSESAALLLTEGFCFEQFKRYLLSNIINKTKHQKILKILFFPSRKSCGWICCTVHVYYLEVKYLVFFLLNSVQLNKCVYTNNKKNRAIYYYLSICNTMFIYIYIYSTRKNI